jgi:hypothetical protein
MQIIRTGFWKKSALSSYLIYKSCFETKDCPFAHGLLYTYSLAKRIVMTDKSLCSFSISVRFGVKHSTSSDVISYEAIHIKHYECVSVFLPKLTGTLIISFLRNIIQGDQKVFVHLTITGQKTRSIWLLGSRPPWLGGTLDSH